MERLVSNLRFTFLLFVLTGGALIYALSRLAQNAPVRSNAQWILMSSVIGLMVIFGAIVWVRSQGAYETDGDAEAFYYLGFIYTLITLVVTFVPLLAEGSYLSTRQVLGLFGLGLITTFVGLAGRVFFLQSRTSTSPDLSAQRLAQAYSEAARHIEATSVQIARAAEDLEKLHKQSQEALASSLEKAAEKMVAAVDHVTTTTAEKISSTLGSAAKGMADALDELNQRIAGLKLPPPAFGERLSTRIEELSAATAAATKSAAELGSGMVVISKALTDVASSASGAGSGLAAVNATSRDAALALKQTDAALAGLKGQAADAQQSLAAATASTTKFGSAMTAAFGEVDTLQKNIGALSTPLADLASAAIKTVPALGGLTSESTAASRNLREVAAEMAKSIDTIRSHQARLQALSDDLKADLGHSEAALRKVHENLVSATEFLTSKVK